MSSSNGGNQPFGRDYDQMVVAFDHLLTTLVKVEVLDAHQFEDLCDRLKYAGFTSDDYQLITTFLTALRED